MMLGCEWCNSHMAEPSKLTLELARDLDALGSLAEL